MNRTTIECAKKWLAAGLLACWASIAGATYVYTEIAVPGATDTYAYGLNDNNEIVGGYSTNGATADHAFVYSNGVFSTVNFPGATLTIVGGINNAGTIVGVYYPGADPNQAFVRIGNLFSTITPPASTSAVATGINDAGQVVGWFRNATGTHGYVYSGGVFTTIDAPFPGTRSTAPYGINNLGQVTGAFTDAAGAHGFLLSGGVFTPFDYGTSDSTLALDINDAGQIVGGYAHENGFTAFLRDPSGVVTLIEPPWSVDSGMTANGINNFGVIAGNGNDANGVGRSFLAVPAQLSIATSLLPRGTVGSQYSQSLAAMGGTRPYVWTITSGALPDGLALAGSAIAGVPSAAGTFSFTAQVTDNAGNTATRALSIQIQPAPCTLSLSAAQQSFGLQGGLSAFTVNAPPECSWRAVSSAGWITILPSGSHGTARVNFSVAANSGAARAGRITVDGRDFNIYQQSFSCSYVINPSVASVGDGGGSARVVVNAPAGCAWNATSNVGWITVTSGQSGSGNGQVVVNVTASVVARSGTVTVAGQVFTVRQAGAAAAACGALDVRSLVAVRSSGFRFLGAAFGTGYYTQDLTVINTSTTFIPGPVSLLLIGLPTHHNSFSIPDSGLTGATFGWTQTTCFTLQGDYRVYVSDGGLQPGQAVSLSLGFVEGGWGLNYQTMAISGTPSH